MTFCSLQLEATHIIGGDISYRCLGGQEYEIRLTLRRDCINGNPGFDNPANLGIFDSKGKLQINLGQNGVLLMPYRTDDTLNEVLRENCGIIGGDLCVHTTTYKDTLTLPYVTGGYILAYQRCCRNYTILNIVDPLATGATYTVHITENALLNCNSSPVLSPYPPIYICGDQPIKFHLAAIDEEGDSLVYNLCNPYLGADQTRPAPSPPSSPPYASVSFKPPYNFLDMIGGNPALAIDPKTGIMTGFAVPIIAQYLIAYCVEEYRDGKLLSILRRDFQINVRICNSVPKANFEYTLNTCSDPIELKILDQSTDLFSQINFWDWKVILNSIEYNSSNQNPSFKFQDTGLAKVQLVIRSKELCNDTLIQNIFIKSVKPTFDSLNYTICRGDSINLIKSFNTNARYTWTPSTGLSCANCPNPRASPQKDTKYVLTTSDSTCTRADSQFVFVKNCTIDSCAIEIRKTCLANGMIELAAIDAYGKLIQAKPRVHELFWDIKQSQQDPAVSLLNRNPILLRAHRIFSLTSKIYNWEQGVPKTIEFANICKRILIDSSNLECAGPCAEIQFILSSCEDDYDQEHNLNFPSAICESICSNACNYIVALFETNGTLIDPSKYKIKWSTGGTGAYVMMMGPYYNTLTAEVQYGDCIWYGRYWKRCKNYSGNFQSNSSGWNLITDGIIDIQKTQELIRQSESSAIYNLTGQLIEKSQIENLQKGMYFLLIGEDAQQKVYKFIR
ncbi:MAG: T9SS type A sorting domain-containing protein [Saprospiraceae bacterium]|nr:T9SS type A sorting domain-containing protein [Saprospiraceae bacterium]